MSDETLRLVVDEPSSVEVADGLSGTPVRVTAAARRSFPLTTDWTHILGDDVHSAYTNYPNPFAAGREKTTITYYLDYKSRVTLKLYTVWGKPVATLLDNKTREPGLHQDVTWDGKNGDGDVVTNGVYYLLLDIQGYDGTSTSIKRKVGVVR
jgi:hypothetical protein